MTPRRRATCAVVAGALAAVALALATKGLMDSDDAAVSQRRTAAAVAHAYLRALERADPAALRDLAPPGYDARADVEREIASYGGLRPRAAVSTTRDLAPDVLTMRIRGLDAGGRPLQWTENLVRKDGGWFVLLGSLPPRGDARPRSSAAESES